MIEIKFNSLLDKIFDIWNFVYAFARCIMCLDVHFRWNIDGLMQERRNSSALAMELIFLALTYQYMLYSWLSFYRGWCMGQSGELLMHSPEDYLVFISRVAKQLGK